MRLTKILISILITSFLLLSPLAVFAQNKDIDLTYSYSSVDSQAQDGDILVTSEKGELVRSSSTYSDKLFGVLQNSPLIAYRDVDNKNLPVSRTGIAQVNVTDLNGPINKGDYITSSQLAGKGQKASQSGYVLGLALANFTGEGAQTSQVSGKPVKQGKIPVALRVEYAEITTSRTFSRYLDNLNTAFLNNTKDPNQVIQLIRYLAAGVTLMFAFAISFFTFSRAIAKGVEAIGRNPLARNAIQFSILINAALTTVIALVGVIASFLILRL